jgi:hypothetical protein
VTDTPHSRQSIMHARHRLMELLDRIANGVADASLERCPYRAVSDRCTFEHGCRNQIRAVSGARCGGGPLDTSPASP